MLKLFAISNEKSEVDNYRWIMMKHFHTRPELQFSNPLSSFIMKFDAFKSLTKICSTCSIL